MSTAITIEKTDEGYIELSTPGAEDDTCYVCGQESIDTCHYCEKHICEDHANEEPYWCKFHLSACPLCHAKKRRGEL